MNGKDGWMDERSCFRPLLDCQLGRGQSGLRR